jgi:O-antigen/teichoic acid export membrane protein
MSKPIATPTTPSESAQQAPTQAQTGLRHRAMRMGSWLFIEQGVSMVLRLGSALVLSRLLAPDAYGLTTLITTMLVALGMFSDMGVHRSIVQSPRGEDPDFLSTAWTMQVIRGGILSFILLLIAGGFELLGHWHILPKEQIYGDARLPAMIAVMGIVMSVHGAQSTRVLLAQRHMQQRMLTFISLSTQLVSTSLAILVAWWTHSHWTLVVSALTAPLLARVMERLLLPGVPERFLLQKDALTELMTQAKWLLPASILGFLALHADRLVLAGLNTTHDFGLYSIAYMLSSTAQSVAMVVAANVAFPAFSEVVRNRPEQLRNTITKFTWIFDALFITLFCALTVSSNTVVSLLYDARYQNVGWMLGILALGLLGLRSQLVEQCYLAHGRPQFTAATQACRLGVMVIGIYIGHRLGGLYGTLIGISLSQYAGWPIAYWYRIRHGLFSWRSEALFLPAAAAGTGLGWVFNALVHAIRG